MSSDMNGISGMGDNDPGALTPEQQSQLNDFKMQTRLQNEQFLRDHPQISHVLQMFMAEVLKRRPKNIREFAAEYFSDEKLRQKVEQKHLERYLSNFDQPTNVEA